jgi:phenylalanyl-tRNA synthetase beta chain
MKYLYSWLKEFYPNIPSLDSIESILADIGHDSEGIVPANYEGISVAEISAVGNHPNADTLSLVTVKTTSGEREVVCGAPDLKVGQKVAYAAIGTTLPSGMKIQKAKIRGVESSGMLCAADELGLSHNHATLLPLPDSAEVGHSIKSYIEPDAVISLEITPNRGDVLSHFGLARDIAAKTESITLQPNFLTPEYTGKTEEIVRIDSIHSDVNSFSLAGASTEAERYHTPLLMQSRLTLLGARSINLATDITNYVLLEYGQPLHAYNQELLSSNPVFGVRRAHDGETFTGLNGMTYNLTPQSLVIVNNDSPVALAGVLGGDATKVGDTARNIVFESANFNSRQIAKTVRGLGILTDSAQRFSRGVDPNLRLQALAHALALWQKTTKGKAYEPIEKINHSPTPVKTSFTAESASTFIGTQLTEERISTILTALGCEININEIEIEVMPPTWRFDLSLVEDYYEELARLVGLNNLNMTPLSASVPQWKRSKFWREEAVKDTLVNLGANEISTYPFIKETELAHLNLVPEPMELVVPALAEKPLMRPTLIPGTLLTISTNPEIPQIYLFEMAKVYHPDREVETLCISASGNNLADIDNWWKNIFERLRLPVASWMTRIISLPDEVRNDYKIRKLNVTVLELPAEEILSLKQFESPQVMATDLDAIHYSPVAKHQSSRRDIAIVVEKTHSIDDITQVMTQFHPFIIAVELFDTYTDTKLGDDNYSLAFHVFYQSPDKTLTGEEVQSIHSSLENFLKEHYHATIR